MASTSKALRQIFREARPLISNWLDVGAQIAALRDTATAAGLDWSAVKALIKAQIQDERDNNEGKRVTKLLEKAEFATSYADMLGLTKMNEKKFLADDETIDAETGEITETNSPEIPDSSTSARPLTPVAADQPRPDSMQVEAQAPDADLPPLSGALEIGTGDRAVTGIGPESTVQAGRESPRDALDAGSTAYTRKGAPADGEEESDHLSSLPSVHTQSRSAGTTRPGEPASFAPLLAGTEGDADRQPIPTELERIQAEMIAQRKALRPHCLKPKDCHGVQKRHCEDCQRAFAEANGETA